MREKDAGRLNKQLESLLRTLDYCKHQVISSNVYNYSIPMENLEEEQRRKHEMALSRVMKLEQEIARERETSQAHVQEAKQVKVLIVCLYVMSSFAMDRLPWKP